MAFFPIVILVYFALAHKYRWIWLLAASVYFYMSWNPKFIFLILATILITYVCGIVIQKAEQMEHFVLKKVWLLISLVSNLSILFFFKYFDFAVDSINQLLEAAHFKLLNPEFDIMLPVGISFYTFQALSYTIDVYRDKEYKVEKNLARYALFVMFFPQLVAGPIERSRNLLSQFYEKHEFEYERVKSGLLYMLWGLFQKIVIADRAAIIVNQVYNNSDGLPSYGKFQAAIFFKIHKRILAQMAYFFKHMAKGLHLHSAWREQMLKRKEI